MSRGDDPGAVTTLLRHCRGVPTVFQRFAQKCFENESIIFLLIVFGVHGAVQKHAHRLEERTADLKTALVLDELFFVISSTCLSESLEVFPILCLSTSFCVWLWVLVTAVDSLMVVAMVVVRWYVG